MLRTSYRVEGYPPKRTRRLATSADTPGDASRVNQEVDMARTLGHNTWRESLSDWRSSLCLSFIKSFFKSVLECIEDVKIFLLIFYIKLKLFEALHIQRLQVS